MNKVTDCVNSLAMRDLASAAYLPCRSLENIGVTSVAFAELFNHNWFIEVFDVISSHHVAYGKGIVAHLSYVLL